MSALDRRETEIVAVASLSHFLAHFATGLYPAVIELARIEFGLNFADAADLALPGYVAFGAGAIPLGILATRVSNRVLLALGNSLIACAALVVSVSGSPSGVLWGLLGIGLGASVYHPVGYSLISNAIRRRGHAHGLQGIFGNFGVASAPLIGGTLTFLGSWRWSYMFLAVCAGFVALFNWMLKFEETHVDQHSPHQQEIGAGRGIRATLLGLLSLSAALYGFVFRGWELLLPKHLGDTLFLHAASSSSSAPLSQKNLGGTLITGAALIVSAAGQLVGGRLADKVSLAKAYLFFHALSLPFLLGLAGFDDFILLPLSATLFSFFNLGMQPLENSLFARFTPARHRGTSYGLKFTLVFGLGALAVRYVGPIAVENGSSAAFWSLVPFVIGVVLCASVILLVDSRHDNVPPPAEN